MRGNEDTINNVFIGDNPKTLYTLDELYDQIGHIASVVWTGVYVLWYMDV